MKQNITKQLCVCMAVYEFLTILFALELALPSRRFLKWMRSASDYYKIDAIECSKTLIVLCHCAGAVCTHDRDCVVP